MFTISTISCTRFWIINELFKPVLQVTTHARATKQWGVWKINVVLLRNDALKLEIWLSIFDGTISPLPQFDGPLSTQCKKILVWKQELFKNHRSTIMKIWILLLCLGIFAPSLARSDQCSREISDLKSMISDLDLKINALMKNSGISTSRKDLRSGKVKESC